MDEKKERFAVFSGEGVKGTWKITNPMTRTGAKRRLKKERQGGDRWAYIFDKYGHDIETGDFKVLPFQILLEVHRSK